MRKILIIILPVLILIGAFFFGVPALIDTKSLSAQFAESVKQATGEELIIKGKTELSLFPLPNVTVRKVFIRNTQSATTPYLVEVPQAELQIDPASIFSGAKVSGIVLSEPVFWTDKTASKALLALGNVLLHPKVGTQVPLKSLEIKAGKLSQSTKDISENTLASNINLSVSMASVTGPTLVNGTFNYNGKATTIEGNLGNVAEKKDVSLHVKMAQDHVTFRADAALTIEDKNVASAGLWELSITDLPAVTGNKELPAGTLTVSGQITSTNEKASINELQVKGPNIQGKGTASFEYGAIPNLDVNLEWNALDANIVKALFYKPLPEKAVAKDEAAPADKKPEPSAMSFSLTKDVSATIAMKANEIVYRGHQYKNLQFSCQLDGGEMVINQAAVEYAPNSNMSVYGIVRQVGNEANFEGTLEVKGKNPTEIDKWIGVRTGLFSEKDGEYQGKASIYLTPTEMRVPEVQLTTASNRIAGLMIINFGAVPSIQTALRIHYIDLDRLAKSMIGVDAPESAQKEKNAQQVVENEVKPFFPTAWLKQFPAKLLLNATLEGFSMHSKPGVSGSVQMQLSDGRLYLKNTQFTWLGSTFAGDVLLDGTGNLPNISIRMAGNQLSAGDIWEGKSDAIDLTKGWSKDSFNFRPLLGLNADWQIALGKFQYRQFMFDNAQIDVQLQNGQLKIKNVKAGYAGGTIQASGTLTNGQVPGLSLNVTMEGMDADRLLAPLVTAPVLIGKVGVRGNLATSGISPHSWLTNAKGSYSVGGWRFTVDSMDVPRLARSLSDVRTVADVVNVARLSLSQGKTEFSTGEGNLYLEGGVLNTQNMMWHTDRANGQLKGQVNMLEMTMDGIMTFSFTTSDKSNPTAALHISGPLNNPTRQIDTRVLEEYVTRKSGEQLLN